MLLLVVVGLFVVVSVGQRLFARNRALAAQLQAGQAAAPADGPHVYESPTGRFSVEFPGRPKQEFVLSEQRGGLSQWEASFTRGNFAGGQGEQFLCTHLPIGLPPTDEQATARIAALVDATANVGERQGRVLTSRELSEPGVRGREVTYEWTSAHGGRVAGRYRVLLTDREWISLDWVAAPAQPERPEVQRFFDSLEWKKKPMP